MQAAREFGGAGFAVVQPHHALDEDEVGLPRRTRQAPAGVFFASHAKVDRLAGRARREFVDLRIEEIRPALEDAHPPPLARVPACERRHHRGLAVAGSRSGDEPGGAGQFHDAPK